MMIAAKPVATTALATACEADLLEVIFYTDPLCCWSWAMAPQWRKLLYVYRDRIQVRYCMAGLLPGWSQYNDAQNHVQRPIQMGPVWMHAMQLSGMPIHHQLWMQDPPASSYLACIAVKAAGIQSAQAETTLLRLLQEALMLRGTNISTEAAIVAIAVQLSSLLPFDTDQFRADLLGAGLEAFRKDLQEVQQYGIKRYPTVVIKNNRQQGFMLQGFQQYDALETALLKAGDFTSNQQPITLHDYTNYWGSITARELEEIQ